MSGAARLLRPLRRRLRATDNTRRARPLFIEIDPKGLITVWPRRCPKESVSALGLYIYGAMLRKDNEREEKRKKDGKPYVSRRK